MSNSLPCEAVSYREYVLSELKKESMIFDEKNRIKSAFSLASALVNNGLFSCCRYMQSNSKLIAQLKETDKNADAVIEVLLTSLSEAFAKKKYLQIDQLESLIVTATRKFLENNKTQLAEFNKKFEQILIERSQKNLKKQVSKVLESKTIPTPFFNLPPNGFALIAAEAQNKLEAEVEARKIVERDYYKALVSTVAEVFKLPAPKFSEPKKQGLLQRGASKIKKALGLRIQHCKSA